jgi:hypothetical protein
MKRCAIFLVLLICTLAGAQTPPALWDWTRGGSGQARSLHVDQPPFYSEFWFNAPLTNSILPIKGPVPAYTRASIATHTDWEGAVRPILSGEARFQGARRVRNWLTFSEAISNAAWSKAFSGTASVPVITDNFAAGPDGSLTASRIQYTVGAGATTGDDSYLNQAPGGAGHVAAGSVWLKSNTGADQKLTIRSGAGSADDVNITVTSAWQRFASANVGGSFGFYLHQMGNWKTANTADILAWHPQLEDVAGQSNLNPAEYVSVSVLPAPYQGANVDGVQYFANQNGNTVASNVVTEVKGAAIPAATLQGILLEEARTNICLQSEDFSLTWGIIGTPTRTAAAKLCGTVKLDLLGDDDPAVLEGYLQTISFTGDGVKAISLYFAQGTSTSSVVRLFDTTLSTNRLIAIITWSGASPVIAMSTGTLLDSETLANGVFRAKFATTAVTAANVNSLQLFPATDVVLAVANTGTLYMGGVQAENNGFASSYIPTTTGSVARAADQFTVTATGVTDVTKGTAAATFNGYLAGMNAPNPRIIGCSAVNSSTPLSFVSGTRVVSTFDGVNNTSTANSWTDHTVVKAISSWGPNGIRMSLNGGAIAANATFNSLMLNCATLQVGNGPSSTYANFPIRDVKFSKDQLPDYRLQALTQ